MTKLSMDELSSQEQFPEVKQNAIDAVNTLATQAMDDARKQGFDPAIHRVDSMGVPLKSKTNGGFVKFNGRKAGGKNVGPSGPRVAPKVNKSYLHGQDNVKTGPGAALVTVDSTSAARTVSGLIEQASTVLISDEWKYSDIERDANVIAWRDCFDYYGGVQLPPPQALILNHMTIIATRAFAPKTQTKWALAKAWLNDRIARISWGKKKDAYTDNRTDNVGENDIRQEKSESVQENRDQVDRT